MNGTRPGIITAFLLLFLTWVSPLSAKDTPAIPAGSPMADIIYFQYALYYLPTPKKDPLNILKQQLAKQNITFTGRNRRRSERLRRGR